MWKLTKYVGTLRTMLRYPSLSYKCKYSSSFIQLGIGTLPRLCLTKYLTKCLFNRPTETPGKSTRLNYRVALLYSPVSARVSSSWFDVVSLTNLISQNNSSGKVYEFMYLIWYLIHFCYNSLFNYSLLISQSNLVKKLCKASCILWFYPVVRTFM